MELCPDEALALHINGMITFFPFLIPIFFLDSIESKCQRCEFSVSLFDGLKSVSIKLVSLHKSFNPFFGFHKRIEASLGQFGNDHVIIFFWTENFQASVVHEQTLSA